MADEVMEQGPSVDDAARAMAGLFGDPPEAPKEEPEEEAEPQGKLAGRERNEKGQLLPKKKDEESPYAEGEEPEEPEEDGEELTPAEIRKLKVKVDGIEQELPEDEVVKGYSRQADYTRKTQELAEQRRKFVESELEPVRQERQVYAERLAQMAEAIEALVPTREPDWQTLRNQVSPEEFTQAFADWRANAQRLGKVQAEQARVWDLQQKDDTTRLQAMLAVENEKMLAALPEMADAEKGKALKDDLVSYAKSLQFTDDDLAQVYDHRLLVLLDKARRWDQTQQRKPKVEEKIDRALDSLKPSAPKSTSKGQPFARAQEQLANTGRVDDAANVFRNLPGFMK